MRKTLLFSALTVLGLVSCQKQEHSNPVMHVGSETIPLTVTVTGTGTKATNINPANEEKHTSLQVLVFSSNGAVETYKNLEGSGTTLQLGVIAGAKKVYAFLNAPSLKAVASESALLSMVSNLSDNALDSFVMFGSASKTVDKATTIPIEVKRIVAKVMLKKIRAEFPAAAISKEDFIINKFYMENVAATANYGLNQKPTSFYSGAAGDTPVDALIRDAAVNANLKNNGSYTKEHDFYVYPTTGAESPRLVIEGTLMGQTQVYACNLPAITRNCTYEISEVVITRQGGDEYKVDCTVNIAGWDVGLTNYTEIF